MLEVRYNKITGEVTGWWGSRFGKHEVKLKNRPNETIVTLDIPIPSREMRAYLLNEASQSIMNNPSYIEPMPPRDIPTEIDEIKSRVEKLEGRVIK